MNVTTPSRGTARRTHAPGTWGSSLSGRLWVITMDTTNQDTRRTVKCLKVTATTPWDGNQGNGSLGGLSSWTDGGQGISDTLPSQHPWPNPFATG